MKDRIFHFLYSSLLYIDIFCAENIGIFLVFIQPTTLWPYANWKCIVLCLYSFYQLNKEEVICFSVYSFRAILKINFSNSISIHPKHLSYYSKLKYYSNCLWCINVQFVYTNTLGGYTNLLLSIIYLEGNTILTKSGSMMRGSHKYWGNILILIIY